MAEAAAAKQKLSREEQLKGCPTLFQALGTEQNRNVLYTFIGISVLLVVVAFGMFFAGRELIPRVFPSISRYDSPIYACGAAAIVSHVIIFAFCGWAYKHDMAEERDLARAQAKRD